MKKIALLLIVALVLGVSAAAYAGAKKYSLEPTALAPPGARGFIIIHYVKEEKTIGQIQVQGLDPGTYEVMVGPPPGDPVIGTIEVKKNGSGHLHVVSHEAEPTSDPFTINVVDGIDVLLVASIPSFP